MGAALEAVEGADVVKVVDVVVGACGFEIPPNEKDGTAGVELVVVVEVVGAADEELIPDDDPKEKSAGVVVDVVTATGTAVGAAVVFALSDSTADLVEFEEVKANPPKAGAGTTVDVLPVEDAVAGALKSNFGRVKGWDVSVGKVEDTPRAGSVGRAKDDVETAAVVVVVVVDEGKFNENLGIAATPLSAVLLPALPSSFEDSDGLITPDDVSPGNKGVRFDLTGVSRFKVGIAEDVKPDLSLGASGILNGDDASNSAGIVVREEEEVCVSDNSNTAALLLGSSKANETLLADLASSAAVSTPPTPPPLLLPPTTSSTCWIFLFAIFSASSSVRGCRRNEMGTLVTFNSCSRRDSFMGVEDDPPNLTRPRGVETDAILGSGEDSTANYN
jgi:hypothetical protein